MARKVPHLSIEASSQRPKARANAKREIGSEFETESYESAELQWSTIRK